MFKTLSPALLITALICLAGCKNHSSSKVDEQTLKTFTRDMQQALTRSIAMANTGEQAGAVLLKVTLDRHSAPLRCESGRAPLTYELKMPAGVMPTNLKGLNALVEAQCWKTIYPVVPQEMLDENGEVEVRAPIVVVLPAQRHSGIAQQQFFWESLLRDQAVTSIGRASVYYEANAQGHVEGCLVQLYPHPLRRDAFRLDGNLQAQLNSRCMALDMRKMPGFATDERGLARGYSEVDYAPWRVGRP